MVKVSHLPILISLGLICILTDVVRAETKGVLLDPLTWKPILHWDGKNLKDPRTHLAKYVWDGEFIQVHGTWKRIYYWRKGWLHDSNSHRKLFGVDRDGRFIQARTWKRLHYFRKGEVRNAMTHIRFLTVKGDFPLPLLLAYTTGLIR